MKRGVPVESGTFMRMKGLVLSGTPLFAGLRAVAGQMRAVAGRDEGR